MSTLGSATMNKKNTRDEYGWHNTNNQYQQPKKNMNRFAQTFDGIIKSNFRSYEKYNLYWKLLLTWLLKTNATMTTTTRHSRDNDKMADRAQKRRALTKFIQTYID